MNPKADTSNDWHGFTSRMAHQFGDLLGSKPSCMEDVIDELRKQDEWIVPLEPMTRVAPAIEEGQDVLSKSMQRYGYYASVQGPWLVCSRNKKRHDTLLFAAQACQVLAEANMMLVSGQAVEHETGHRRDAA